jgi:hypothetical protein
MAVNLAATLCPGLSPRHHAVIWPRAIGIGLPLSARTRRPVKGCWRATEGKVAQCEPAK